MLQYRMQVYNLHASMRVIKKSISLFRKRRIITVHVDRNVSKSIEDHLRRLFRRRDLGGSAKIRF